MVGPETPGHFATLILDPHGLHLEKNHRYDGMKYPGPGLKSHTWLVVGPPLWKIWKSIGMMTFPIYGKIKNGNQTTNQICLWTNPWKSHILMGFFSSYVTMLEDEKNPAMVDAEKMWSPVDFARFFHQSGWLRNDQVYCTIIFSIRVGIDVPIKHHPTIGNTISNRYLKVMFNIPKKGHLPTPVNAPAAVLT